MRFTERLAGSRDIASKVANYVVDNPYTRGWSNLVTDAAIRPVERMVGGEGLVANSTQSRLAALIVDDLEKHSGKMSPDVVNVIKPLVKDFSQNDVAVIENMMEGMVQKGVMDRDTRIDQYRMLLGGTEDPVDIEAFASRPNMTRPRDPEQWSGRYVPGAVRADGSNKPVGSIDMKRTLEAREAIREMAAQYGDGYSHAYSGPGTVLRQYGMGGPVAAYGAGALGLTGAYQGIAALMGQQRNAGGFAPVEEDPIAVV